ECLGLAPLEDSPHRTRKTSLDRMCARSTLLPPRDLDCFTFSSHGAQYKRLEGFTFVAEFLECSSVFAKGVISLNHAGGNDGIKALSVAVGGHRLIQEPGIAACIYQCSVDVRVGHSPPNAGEQSVQGGADAALFDLELGIVALRNAVVRIEFESALERRL